MKKSYPRILFHVRGSINEDETTFYHKLNHDIEKIGGSLFLVGHHFPNFKELPFFRVPSGTQRVQLSLVHDSFSVNDWQGLGSLIDADQLWRGNVRDHNDLISRKRSLNFFHGYYQLLLNYIQPSLVIIWNGYHPQEKILADLAKNRGCRIGYVERGPIPGTIHYDSQGILAASSFARQIEWHWETDGASECWREIFEKIKLGLKKTPQTWWKQPKTRERSQLLKRLNLDPERPVLLFAGQVDKDVQTMFFSSNFPTCLDALKWVVKKMSKYPDWQLLGKHHPQSTTSLSEFKKTVSGCGVWVDDISLADAIGLSSAVIAVNSTVLYEGMMSGLPGFSIGDGVFSGKDVFYEYTETNSDEILDAFLKRVSFDLRMRRFNDMMAYSLAFHLYDFVGGWCRYGANGSGELAARWVSEASENPCSSQNNEEYLEILRFLSDKSVEPSLSFLAQTLKKKLIRELKKMINRLK